MKTLLTIKTDKKIKETARDVAEEIGVPLSTVINAFLRQFVRDKEVSFSASYNPSPYLRGVIDEVEKDLALGKIKFVEGINNLKKKLEQ